LHKSTNIPIKKSLIIYSSHLTCTRSPGLLLLVYIIP
jgi:hypothetical protein